jgi:hypothetical protein
MDRCLVIRIVQARYGTVRGQRDCLSVQGQQYAANALPNLIRALAMLSKYRSMIFRGGPREVGCTRPEFGDSPMARRRKSLKKSLHYSIRNQYGIEIISDQ